MFSDVKYIHGGSGITEHAMVVVSPAAKDCRDGPKMSHLARCPT